MCGRYMIRDPREEMQRYFQFVHSEIEFGHRFNIAPTQAVPIIVNRDGTRRAVSCRWGLIPSWAGPEKKLPLMINARSESLSEKPVFRKAFAERRCIFPVSGYYEWRTANGDKQPFLLTRADGQPLALAGIWEPLNDPIKQSHVSGAIVTTEAAPELRAIHDRMPVFLAESSWGRWLGQGNLDETESFRLFETQLPFPISAQPVGRLVNSIKNEGPQLIEPMPIGKTVLRNEQLEFGL